MSDFSQVEDWVAKVEIAQSVTEIAERQVSATETFSRKRY